MTTVKDFTLNFDPLESLRRMGRDQRLLLGRNDRREDYPAALAEALTLVRPAYSFEIFPVLHAEPGRLLVGDGTELESLVIPALVARASEVVMLVSTIGPDLEGRVRQLKGDGKNEQARILDFIGTLAVDEIGRVANRHITEIAITKGVKASIPLNPGTSHWPLAGNRIFERLCSLGEIGVSVAKSDFLVPFKSISMALALGTDVLTPDQGSSCDYCDNRHLCDEAFR